MGFSVTRSDFIYNNNVNLKGSTPSITYSQCLFLNLIEDMIHNGFTLFDSEIVDQNGNTSRPPSTQYVSSSNPITNLQMGTVTVVLIPTASVDPLISSNPWFVKISTVDAGNLTPGGVTYRYSGISIGVGYYSPSIEQPKIGSATESLVQMYNILPAVRLDKVTPYMYSSSPYSYTLTIVQRGFALNISSQTTTENLQNSGYFVVQRALSCGGTITTTGNVPLYLVTNITPVSLLYRADATNPDGVLGPQASWFGLVVREKVITAASPGWNYSIPLQNGYMSSSVGSNGADYVLKQTNISDVNEYQGKILHRFPDRWNAPVTRDTGEYVLLFPFGICSSRFAYTDELDLIAVSKANAYQYSQIVPVTVYGQNRSYLAGASNNSQVGNNSGVRAFLYTVGTEINASSNYTDVNVQPTTTITNSWGNNIIIS